MPRIHITLNEKLYEDVLREANKKGVSTSNYIYNLVAKNFDNSGFDLLEEYQNLREEAEEMAKETDGKFSLNDLPTYKNIDEKLKKSNCSETAKQTKIRLSMMFRENADSDDWIIENNGRYMVVEKKSKTHEEDYAKRMLDYSDKFKKLKDSSKGRKKK